MSGEKLRHFVKTVTRPLVIVGTLKAKDRPEVATFLLKLNAPVYLEGTSGLREDPRLTPIRIAYIKDLWEQAEVADYPINGILRLGGVPTCRPWRDLEGKQGLIEVYSISHLPFSGLSWGEVSHVDMSQFFSTFELVDGYDAAGSAPWISSNRGYYQTMCDLFAQLPQSEPSLFYDLSRSIPRGAMVYLGNSLPIREWDLAATYEDRALDIVASRGLNGIDGQVSTFLGLCQSGRENWGIVGDLTALYDMAGPWIWPQLREVSFTLVVVNNGGGKIFSRMFSQAAFQNSHTYDFRALADFWRLPYERWTAVPEQPTSVNPRLVELVPDEAATARFWEEASLSRGPRK